MGHILTAALALVDQLRDALAADERTSTAVATLDPVEASASSLAGGTVLVAWPSVEFVDTVDGAPVVEWELRVAVRAGASLAEAWARLDDLLDVLAGVLDVATAEPATFTDPTGTEPRVGFLLTLHPIDL